MIFKIVKLQQESGLSFEYGELYKTFKSFNSVQGPSIEGGSDTIGYGHKLLADDKNLDILCDFYNVQHSSQLVLTPLSASYLMWLDLSDLADTVRIQLNGMAVNQDQFTALVDVACGGPYALGFKDLINDLKSGVDPYTAFKRNADRQIYGGLKRRRACALNIYLNGVYSDIAIYDWT